MADYFTNLSVAPLSLWAAFAVGVVVLLLVDLSLFGKAGQEVPVRSALLESGLWVAVALAFNAWFAASYGADLGLEFLTGYLVEKSLSVDNLFVILLVFASFKIPSSLQHRVLFYGVLGAVLLRALFIVIGAQLIHSFEWILYFFGLVLIVTAIKFLRDTDKDNEVQSNWAVSALRRVLPCTEDLRGESFFVLEGGVRKATPLFLALMVIEATDLVFAVDSIPAVFAVTQDAFVAFASNILAILGMRALYFVLAVWVAKLRYLKPGLAVILGFIGIKMLIKDFYKIPSWISLAIIFSVLLTAALSSWYVSRVEKEEQPPAGPTP